MSQTLNIDGQQQVTHLDKNSLKVVLLEGVHQSAADAFVEMGYQNVELIKTSVEGHELNEILETANILGIRSRTMLTKEVLAKAKQLLAVGCFCIGTNQVHLQQASRMGIPVFNAPYSNTRSVAELVLAQSILLMRRVPEKNLMAHRGVWEKSAKDSFEIRGKTLGIIGYGSIGSQLSVLAESLGMKVLFTDTLKCLPLGNANQVELSELLKRSDIVSLHVPETELTKSLIGRNELQLMKDKAVLINASRGTVIDIDALVQTLQSGKLLGAAIDVFPTEPKSNDEEFSSPLRKFDRVILTPHIGGSTVEAQENIGTEVAEKLVRYTDKGCTVSSVNLPQVALPAHPGKHRLLHLHENRPGILASINQTLSENGINISGQYLQTNEDVGYVVVDIDAESSELAKEKIRSIPGTIRCRHLW